MSVALQTLKSNQPIGWSSDPAAATAADVSLGRSDPGELTLTGSLVITGYFALAGGAEVDETSVGGTPKRIKILIDAVPYYFLAYPESS